MPMMKLLPAWALLPLLLTACATAPPRSPAPAAPELAAPRQALLQTLERLIGTPYRYGGSSPRQGFDCSGLVQYAYGRAGVRVPRTVASQWRQADPVAWSRLRPGDLVFFDTGAKNGHVGIYIGDGVFIHAPSSGGRVRRDRLDNPYWRPRIRGLGSFVAR